MAAETPPIVTRAGPLQELAAVDAPVAVLVVEIEHALVDLAPGSSISPSLVFIDRCSPRSALCTIEARYSMQLRLPKP